MHHLTAREVMHWWSWEPWVVVLLALTLILYAIGGVRASRPHRRGRDARTPGWWRPVAFVLGWLALVVALVSPIDALSEILFSAHMTQHELLMIVAAPLMVFGRPLATFIWALPAGWRVPVGKAVPWHFLGGPIPATLLHALALWIWHLPSLYQLTLRNEGIHAVQHLSFFLTAALFWWALVHGRYGRMGYGVAVAYVFVTAAHSGLLGALIALSPSVIYPIYQQAGAPWGINPIEDQQLAGIIMWIPAGVLFTVVGVALFAGWLGEAERRVALTRAEGLRKGEP
jgi:putative membrane protein